MFDSCDYEGTAAESIEKNERERKNKKTSEKVNSLLLLYLVIEKKEGVTFISIRRSISFILYYISALVNY
jgi:hypothetical protein